MLYQSIQQASEELRSGIVTPTELLADTLNSIDQLDSDVQAFITVMRDQAYEEAEKAESEQRTGLFRSPLHGIPFAIKDIIAVKHVHMTAGSQVLADYIAQEDAAVVEQLRRAGAVIIGKTNTHEFAYGTYTPPTHNPWNLQHIAGGSSGGSAASVAAGMSLAAIGSDTGGSIRIPSACCGVTGLKPTYGRVSTYGVIPLSWSLDHVGPIARSAGDCAILFDAIAGYDPRDPNSVSGPPAKTSSSLISGVEGRDPLSLQGIKVGVPSDAYVAPLDPQIRAAWHAALLVMQEEGVEIEHVELQSPNMDTYRTIQMPEASLAHMQRGWLVERIDAYTERTRSRLLQGQTVPAVDYLRAQQERRAFSSNLRTSMQGIHALVLPTLPIPAIRIDQADTDILIDGVTENATIALLRLTMPYNLAGLPAISLPCGFSSDDLPIGLQIVGKPFEESMILRIAHAYQQLTDWHRREIKTQS